MNINFERSKEKKTFAEVQDRECFYSGGVLYMKIFSQDLKEYGIDDIINAISIINAGVTFFQPDEEVYISSKNTSR